MEIIDHYPAREDKMTNRCSVVRADFRIKAYHIAAKPDRRFKSGFRVMEQTGFNLMVDFWFCRNERFLIGQTWHVGAPGTTEGYGIYQVVQMDPECVKMIPVTISQNNNKEHLVIPERLDLLYYGYSVGEGSTQTIKK